MTGPIDLGQTYRYRQTIRNTAGALANAGTVTCNITLPDGTLATPTPVNSSTGVYDISYTTAQTGLHQVRGSATGGVLSAEFDYWTDSFVVANLGQSFISVDEASDHLRAASVLTSDDDREKLRWLTVAASDAVERDLNLNICWRTVTETYDGGGYHINLATKPPRAANGGSIAITTAKEDGVTVTDYTLRKLGWRLMRGTGTSRTCWAAGWENIEVTYRSGCIEVPEVARRVALNTLQTMWQSSQQAEHPFLDEVARRASLATLSTDVLPSLSQVEQRAYNALKSVNYA